jgi:hypothetical protein
LCPVPPEQQEIPHRLACRRVSSPAVPLSLPLKSLAVRRSGMGPGPDNGRTRIGTQESHEGEVRGHGTREWGALRSIGRTEDRTAGGAMSGHLRTGEEHGRRRCRTASIIQRTALPHRSAVWRSIHPAGADARGQRAVMNSGEAVGRTETGEGGYQRAGTVEARKRTVICHTAGKSQDQERPMPRVTVP